MGTLSALRTLDLRCVLYRAALSLSLSSLAELCAGENRLTSLPPSVGTLSAVRTLDLRCVLYRAA